MDGSIEGRNTLPEGSRPDGQRQVRSLCLEISNATSTPRGRQLENIPARIQTYSARSTLRTAGSSRPPRTPAGDQAIDNGC